MQFSWTITVVAVLVNWAWIASIYVAQAADKSLPPRGSIIPGTKQKFLYLRDFWTMTWGDWLGLALIDTAFAHAIANGCFGVWSWCILVFMVGAITAGFAKMCLGDEHKPDYGFPDVGGISLAGLLHAPYFGLQVTLSAFCIWFILTGAFRGTVLCIFLGGGVVYVICAVADKKGGNLDPLTKG